MSSRRVLILVAAVALAAITALATFNYVSSADERAFGDAELIEVFMVTKDIQKGFPGERALDEGYIDKAPIPKKFAPAKAVINAQTLRGKVALAPLAAGLPVVDGGFVEPRLANESFAQRIDTGMQAVTLSMSDVQGVARLVVPGDKVNMMVTLDPEAEAAAAAAKKTTQYVLQGIEVLAVGNATELLPGEQPAAVEGQEAGQVPVTDSGLITFSVPGIDAERLVHASLSGTVHLTLVPPDFTPAPVPPVNRDNLFS
ncbi:MAG: Flp pilus assembly protein CpaB [Acidimicrobiia bacterium]